MICILGPFLFYFLKQVTVTGVCMAVAIQITTLVLSMDICAGLCLEEPHCLLDLPLGSASSLLGLLSKISFQDTNSQLKERELLRISGRYMSLTF